MEPVGAREVLRVDGVRYICTLKCSNSMFKTAPSGPARRSGARGAVIRAERGEQGHTSAVRRQPGVIVRASASESPGFVTARASGSGAATESLERPSASRNS